MKLVNNEVRGFTDYIRLTAADMIAIGSGNSRVIATIPVGGSVDMVGVINTVDIVGSSSLVVDIGITGTPSALISAMDVDAQVVNLPLYNTGTDFVQAVATTTFKGGALPVRAVSVATPVLLRVTDAALATITAGEIFVVLRILDPLTLNQ